MKSKDEIRKEIKERVKLNWKERIVFVLHMIVIAIVVGLIITTNEMIWGLVAVLWIELAGEQYINIKTNKLHDMQQEELLNIIEELLKRS